MVKISDKLLISVFKNYKNIATVGFSKDPGKWAHIVPKFLIEKGYMVFPVNPTAKEILGLKSYPDLLSVPHKVEIVQIFRPSEEVPAITEHAIKRGDVRVIWMQKGISNDEAAKKAETKGIIVIQDRCMYEEYTRLFGA
jgi:Predicted CoA-binding protein